MPKRKPLSTRVEDADFVDAYQLAATTAECAAKLGMSPRLVINRAARLRGRGVPLKKMPNSRGSRGPEYVQSLIARAQKLAPKS